MRDANARLAAWPRPVERKVAPPLHYRLGLRCISDCGRRSVSASGARFCAGSSRYSAPLTSNWSAYCRSSCVSACRCPSHPNASVHGVHSWLIFPLRCGGLSRLRRESRHTRPRESIRFPARYRHNSAGANPASPCRQFARRNPSPCAVVSSARARRFLHQQPCWPFHRNTLPVTPQSGCHLPWTEIMRGCLAQDRISEGPRLAKSITAAGARPAATAAFARHVAIPAKDRAIAARLKRHGRRLPASRANHWRTLRWCRTVA